MVGSGVARQISSQLADGDGKATEALTMKREDGTAEAVPGGYDDAVPSPPEVLAQ